MDHAKFWFRHRRATIKATAASLLLACLIATRVAGQPPPEADEASAAHTQPVAEVPAALQNFLESVSSFSARFVQELWSDDQRLIEVAEGDVELQRPGRFRWHYDTPWEQLIVADGETLWMYDVDISQVTRSDLTATDPGNPGALLAGDSSVLDGFDVAGSGADNDEVWVTLTPRLAQSDYSSVRVAFENQDAEQALRALEFVDGLNQTTVIRFNDVEVNREIDPQRFEFEVPADAHVLGGPG